MADSGSGWTGWEEPNGDAMFVADGPKLPVLVRVQRNGQDEHVLAQFTSIEAASVFQDWMNRSFEETALANQQLSLGAREAEWGMTPRTGADEREAEEGYRPPWMDSE